MTRTETESRKYQIDDMVRFELHEGDQIFLAGTVIDYAKPDEVDPPFPEFGPYYWVNVGNVIDEEYQRIFGERELRPYEPEPMAVKRCPLCGAVEQGPSWLT